MARVVWKYMKVIADSRLHFKYG